MTKRKTIKLPLRRLIVILLLALLLCGCSASESCPVTEPVWTVPPNDPAVSGTPGYGYYIMNEDRSIWAAAWWEGQDENYLISGEDIKAGWFRPAGKEMEITGHRLDGAAPELEAYIPCCYPTRFQATGLFFPSEGCWEVTARAGESVLRFVVEVEP